MFTLGEFPHDCCMALLIVTSRVKALGWLEKEAPEEN